MGRYETWIVKYLGLLNGEGSGMFMANGVPYDRITTAHRLYHRAGTNLIVVRIVLDALQGNPAWEAQICENRVTFNVPQ